MTSIATASLALAVAALTAGCAADSHPAASGSEPRVAPEYRTGSNIPVREPRSTADTEKSRATPADAPRPAEAPAKPAN